MKRSLTTPQVIVLLAALLLPVPTRVAAALEAAVDTAPEARVEGAEQTSAAPMIALDTSSEEKVYGAGKITLPVEVPEFVSRIRFSGRVQPLWKIWGEHDSDQWGAVGLGDIHEDEGFRVYRWRFGVSVAFMEHVVFDVSMGESEFQQEHDVNLMEAKITLTYFDFANFIIGADKLPFGREHMTSSRNMQFIFRPIQVEEMVIPKLGADPKNYDPEDFNGIGLPDRDVGITVAGRVMEGMFRYYAGIYNGTGDFFSGVENYQDDDDFLEIMKDYCYVLRAVVNPLGEFPDVEGDFQKCLRVSLGASAFFNDISLTKDFDNRYIGWGVDGEIKGYGLSLRGEWLQSEQELNYLDSEIENTKRGGWFIQGGFFLLPNYLEAVYRYEDYDDNDHLDDNGDIKYHTIGLNYYVKGDHNFKVQVNYLIRGEDGPEIYNDGLYALMQAGF